MTRRRKILIGVGAAAGTLLLALGLLLYTPPGLRLVARLVTPLSGGTVQVSGLDGFLPNHIIAARVEVADNGIGIPEEYAAKVFVIFQRLHGRDEYEGTGIGLSLAKKIVEFHGGAIAVVPSPLGGACLSFTLPLAEVAAHE